MNDIEKCLNYERSHNRSLKAIKDSLSKYINENGEPINLLMKESKIGRLYQYIEDPERVFAIISANRNENSNEENAENYSELKRTARKLGYGYIEFVGGYKETDENGNVIEVVEPSLMIPNISRDEAVEIGKRFKQESVLYKDGKTMAYISTSGDNIGEITDKFNCGKGKSNFILNDIVNPYFSRLRKGSHRKDNISFVLSERNYIGETFRKSFSGGKSSPKWYDINLNESSINRVKKWFEEKECACISAYRGRLENITDKTCIDQKEGHKFTKEENQGRSKLLKAWLLKLGYGVTAQDGIYVEETSGQKSDGKEVSFLVVNLNDDPEFFNNLFKISEYFNQDSFLYKKPEDSEAFLVGTNKADFPGYGNRESVGTFRPIANDGFLSKIGSKAYQFKQDEGKNIDESIELAVCESTFKRSQMNTKVLIDHLFKKFPKENPIKESSLGRIYDMITREDCVFGIMSAFRKDIGDSIEEMNELNEKRHIELKNLLSSGEPRYGFVELRGAYKEEGYEGNDIFEKSLLIGKIPREKLIELGKKFDQDAVIWHGDGKFEMISRDGSTMNFAKDSMDVKREAVKELKELAEKDPEKFKKLFILGSWLSKGSSDNKNRKFSFVMEARMAPNVYRGMIEKKFGPERTWVDRFEFKTFEDK